MCNYIILEMNLMIDIHNHLLMNVDDGPVSEDEVLNLLHQAIDQGITNIMLTPHHYAGRYMTPKDTVVEKLAEIQKLIDDNDLDIAVHPGQEIRINENIIADLASGFNTSLNDSRYILVEMPFTELPPFYETVIDELIENRYIPVIAHPERCAEIAGNPGLLYQLVNKGALAQVTAASVTGDFGEELQETAFKMIENGLIHVVASDAHHAEVRPFMLRKAFETIDGRLGEQVSEKLKDNARKIFADEPVAVDGAEHIR